MYSAAEPNVTAGISKLERSMDKASRIRRSSSTMKTMSFCECAIPAIVHPALAAMASGTRAALPIGALSHPKPGSESIGPRCRCRPTPFTSAAHTKIWGNTIVQSTRRYACGVIPSGHRVSMESDPTRDRPLFETRFRP
jgi:hypothetical protein